MGINVRSTGKGGERRFIFTPARKKRIFSAQSQFRELVRRNLALPIKLFEL